MKRKSLIFLQLLFASLAGLVLWNAAGSLPQTNRRTVVRRDSNFSHSSQLLSTQNAALHDEAQDETLHYASNYQQVVIPTNDTVLEAALPYVRAIMDRDDVTFPRLECPKVTGRYDYLRVGTSTSPGTDKVVRYFFALNLHQNAAILPRLLGSIVEVIRHLGPQSCAISIVEGRSTDGTYEILYSLIPQLQSLGVKFYLQQSSLDPLGDRIDRVETLAKLRDLALSPITDPSTTHFFSTTSTSVIFLNDVAICPDDILELLHQRLFQSADMVCGMDWTYVGDEPTFYDVWISRDMRGELFFNIPGSSGSWNEAWNLFWNNSPTRTRFFAGLPFQVFSCWNGAAVFTAKPLLEKKVKFRGPHDFECYEGEPKLFCKDMWMHGFGRIAVVPSVNLEYSDAAAQKIKDKKGYVANWLAREQLTHNQLAVDEAGNQLNSKIEWEESPPELVKCMPDYYLQTWTLWDQGLSRYLFT